MKHSLFFAATSTPPDIPMKRSDLFKRSLLAAGAGLAGSSELFAQAPKLSTTYAGQLDMLKGPTALATPARRTTLVKHTPTTTSSVLLGKRTGESLPIRHMNARI
jgi:hypothetical protein